MSDTDSSLAQERVDLALHVEMCERRQRRIMQRLAEMEASTTGRMLQQNRKLDWILRLHLAVIGLAVTYLAPQLMPILAHLAPLARAASLLP